MEDNKITHLDILKHIIETDPWEIAHRLWTCMDCPKLEECNVASKPYHNGKFGNTPVEVCRSCIGDWLNEEVEEIIVAENNT